MRNIIHENKSYAIILDRDNSKYIIQNKETQVNEHETTILPEALRMCEALEFALRKFYESEEKKEIDALSDLPIISTSMN